MDYIVLLPGMEEHKVFSFLTFLIIKMFSCSPAPSFSTSVQPLQLTQGKLPAPSLGLNLLSLFTNPASSI